MNPGYPKQQDKKYHDGGRLKNRLRSLYGFNSLPTWAFPVPPTLSCKETDSEDVGSKLKVERKKFTPVLLVK
jgi:hypothetical protein